MLAYAGVATDPATAGDVAYARGPGVVAWARDGHLVGAGEHPAPWRQDGPSRWTQSDVVLEPAAWVMVVVHRTDNGYSAGVSDAVVVG